MDSYLNVDGPKIDLDSEEWVMHERLRKESMMIVDTFAPAPTLDPSAPNPNLETDFRRHSEFMIVDWGDRAHFLNCLKKDLP